jgi:polysaccharide export outer membrane protein
VIASVTAAEPGLQARPLDTPQPAAQTKPSEPQKPGTVPPTTAPTQQQPTTPAGKPSVPAQKPATPPQAVAAGVTPPPGYLIGPDDVIGVLFWREKDLTVDKVVVRPDGMITLPLLNDIKAAGLTPEQLRDEIMKAAEKFVEEPNATVVVREINSRKVYVTGQVTKPGSFPLTGPTTVMQALAMAGGLGEFAKGDEIVVMRTTAGKTQTFKFNYKDVIKGKKLEQNIELRPGDTVVVP